MKTVAVMAALCAVSGTAYAGVVNIDFSVEDDLVTPLVNGQEINSPGEFGNLFTITSTGRAAIFDTNNPGPNDGGGDPDLLVNTGNALIIQNSDLLDQTVADIFDTPDDNAGNGSLFFNMLAPTPLVSIDVIDVDDANGLTVTLTDADGFVREWDVPNNFTNEINTSGPAGFDTLSFLNTMDQVGEGGGIAMVTRDDLGFDPTRVTTLEVNFTGSGAVDNFVFVPAPGAAALLGAAGVMAVRRRRA